MVRRLVVASLSYKHQTEARSMDNEVDMLARAKRTRICRHILLHFFGKEQLKL